MSIFTSIEANPKIAFVGKPVLVAIDSGQREERPVGQRVAVDQEELVGLVAVAIGHGAEPYRWCLAAAERLQPDEDLLRLRRHPIVG